MPKYSKSRMKKLIYPNKPFETGQTPNLWFIIEKLRASKLVSKQRNGHLFWLIEMLYSTERVH